MKSRVIAYLSIKECEDNFSWILKLIYGSHSKCVAGDNFSSKEKAEINCIKTVVKTLKKPCSVEIFSNSRTISKTYYSSGIDPNKNDLSFYYTESNPDFL